MMLNIIEVVKNREEEEILSYLSSMDDGKMVLEALKSSRDEEGKTVLHWAAAKGKVRVLEYVLGGSIVFVDVVDTHFNTPLHLAVISNELSAVEILLENGADINAQDGSGMTPIHWAIENQSLECIRILVGYKPNLSIEDNRGRNPLVLIDSIENRSIAESILLLLDPFYMVRDGLQVLSRRNKLVRMLSSEAFDLSNLQIDSSLDVYSSKVYSRRHLQLLVLCRVWGLIKYVHPFLSYNPFVNWDDELLSVLDKVVLGELSERQYLLNLVEFVEKLNDANTRIIFRGIPVTRSNLSEIEGSKHGDFRTRMITDSNSSHLGREVDFLRDDGIFSDLVSFSNLRGEKAVMKSKSYFFSDLTSERVVIIELNVYEDYKTIKDLCRVFIEAATTADGIVFDLRDRSKSIGVFDIIKRDRYVDYLSPTCVINIFQEAFRVLLKKPLVLSTTRQRVHNGIREYAEVRFSRFGECLGQGVMINQAEVLYPLDTVLNCEYKISFVIDSRVPYQILRLIMSLQAADLATCVYQVEDYLAIDPKETGFVAVYEPFINFQTLDISRGFKDYMDIQLMYRLDEYVNADSSVGFNPDCVLVVDSSSVSSGEDSVVVKRCYCVESRDEVNLNRGSRVAIDCAVMYASGRWRRRDRLQYSFYPVLPKQSKYYDPMKEMSLSMRLFGFFTLWNAIDLFYVYRHLMEVSMEFIFPEYVELFEKVKSEAEYSMGIAHLISRLRDSNAFVRSSQFGYIVGTHVPSIGVHRIGNEMVVVWVDLSTDEVELNNDHDLKSRNRVNVGDVILEVDGNSAEARCEILDGLHSHSTQQSKIWRINTNFLAGKQGSNARLSIRRKVVGDPIQTSRTERDNKSLERIGDYEYFEIELPRTIPVGNESHRQFGGVGSSVRVLDEVDSNGKKIIYLDLISLPMTRYEATIDLLLSYDFGSMIFDLRGHLKGDIDRIISRFISKTTPVSVTRMSSLIPLCMTHEFGPSMLVSHRCVTPYSRCYCPGYDRKIICLISEETISDSEYAVQTFKLARKDVIFVGRRTNGTIGRSTNIMLPGGVLVGFTSIGITGIDGESIQGNGIIPDFHVDETMDTIISGGDAFLKEAIRVLQDGR